MKKKLERKLTLNKETLSVLNKVQMNNIKGGTYIYCPPMPTGTCKTYTNCTCQ